MLSSQVLANFTGAWHPRPLQKWNTKMSGMKTNVSTESSEEVVGHKNVPSLFPHRQAGMDTANCHTKKMEQTRRNEHEAKSTDKRSGKSAGCVKLKT